MGIIAEQEDELLNPYQHPNAPIVEVAKGAGDVVDVAESIKKDTVDGVEKGIEKANEGVGVVIEDVEEEFDTIVSKIGIPGHGV